MLMSQYIKIHENRSWQLTNSGLNYISDPLDPLLLSPNYFRPNLDREKIHFFKKCTDPFQIDSLQDIALSFS